MFEDLKQCYSKPTVCTHVDKNQQLHHKLNDQLDVLYTFNHEILQHEIHKCERTQHQKGTYCMVDMYSSYLFSEENLLYYMPMAILLVHFYVSMILPIFDSPFSSKEVWVINL